MNNNIKIKINMLYDFVYSKSYDNNIKSLTLNPTNIKLDDIKIKNSSSIEHTNILIELLEGKFKLIEYNQSTNMTILQRLTDGYSSYLHINPYDKNNEIDTINSKYNNDSLFSYLLSSLVLNKKLTHILLPIINIDVDFQQIIDIFKPFNTIFDNYKSMLENNSISNIFFI